MEAMIKTGADGKSNGQPTAIAAPAASAVTVSDWLQKLDNGDQSNDCPLNTGPFLDMAVYLKSLSPSSDPQKVFNSLHKTARTIVKAQNVIQQMLRQGAGK